MLSDRRGDQLKATRKQAAETEKQPADRPRPTTTTTNEPTSPKRGRKAQDERGRRRRANREPKDGGKADKKSEGRRKGERGRKRRRQGGKRRRQRARREESEASEEGRARPGRQEARQAEKDNRQPQEHEQERQEDKLVPTTTRESNSLRAQGRDGRVVVRRRRRTAATANVVAPTDSPTERAQHPDTGSDRSGEGGPENPSTRGTNKVVHASGRIGTAGLSTVWGDTAAVAGIAKTAQNARLR